MKKGRQKGCWELEVMDSSKKLSFRQKETMSSRYNKINAHMNSETAAAACTRPGKVQARQGPTTGWEMLAESPPLTKKLFVVFFNVVSLGLSNHTVEQNPCTGVAGQHKTNSGIFLDL